MKKLALMSGADEEPSSATGGIEGGSGAVSMRTFWLKLNVLAEDFREETGKY